MCVSVGVWDPTAAQECVASLQCGGETRGGSGLTRNLGVALPRGRVPHTPPATVGVHCGVAVF